MFGVAWSDLRAGLMGAYRVASDASVPVSAAAAVKLRLEWLVVGATVCFVAASASPALVKRSTGDAVHFEGGDRMVLMPARILEGCSSRCLVF